MIGYQSILQQLKKIAKNIKTIQNINVPKAKICGTYGRD
jgi:hypothetical protein